MGIVIVNKNAIMNEELGKIVYLNDLEMTYICSWLECLNVEAASKKISMIYNIPLYEAQINLNRIIDEVSNPYPGELPITNYMVLEPTNYCDANCIHCFHKFNKINSWSKKEINKYIEVLKKNNIQYVSLTGGEIFSKHFQDNAKYLILQLKLASIRIVSISTNAMFLDSDLLIWLNDNLNKQETTFRVSLDSIDEKKIEKYRPGYINYNNIDIIDVINRLSFNVVITTIISEQTSKEILDIAKLIAKGLTVKRWILKPLIPVKKNFQNVDIFAKSLEIYEDFLNYFKDNSSEVKYDFILGNFLSRDMLLAESEKKNLREYCHPCKEERYQRTLKSNGRLSRCPVLGEISEYYQVDMLNNIIEYNYKELFDRLECKDMKCFFCDYYKVCQGGCRAYAIAMTGDMYACDITARLLFDWVSKSEYFKNNWPAYYKSVRKIIE